jgi:hypothetical protein
MPSSPVVAMEYFSGGYTHLAIRSRIGDETRRCAGYHLRPPWQGVFGILSMVAWEMVLEHRYAEAKALYEQQMAGNPSYVLIAEYATALLCTGHLDRALAEFRRANAMAAQILKGESQPYLSDIGTVLWLLGEPQPAVETFELAVNGIENGSIKFADNAGGVSEGLLLWFAGSEQRENECLDLLNRCASVENPIMEQEWYLARAETTGGK